MVREKESWMIEVKRRERTGVRGAVTNSHLGLRWFLMHCGKVTLLTLLAQGPPFLLSLVFSCTLNNYKVLSLQSSFIFLILRMANNR